MFEMKIDFPKKITSEIIGYEALIEFYEKMSTIYDSEITIDFRYNYWFEANLCAVFGAMIEELENRGNSTNVINVKKPKDILSRNGFLVKYGVPQPEETYNTEIDYKNVNYITSERYFESPEIMLKNGDILLNSEIAEQIELPNFSLENYLNKD